MSLVNPGVVETRAKIPLPASIFSSDDVPTFERPMKANSGNDSSGHESKSGALRSKMADEMFTMKTDWPLSQQMRFGDTTNFPVAVVYDRRIKYALVLEEDKSRLETANLQDRQPVCLLYTSDAADDLLCV